jgi:ferredoxin
MPDSAGIAYGRNPNKQTWKFERFASRLKRIIDDVKAKRTAYHFDGWSLLGWVSMYTKFGQKMIKPFFPAANADRCVGCGICAKVCPIGNITMQTREDNKVLTTNGNNCTACLSCVHFCPHQAMELGGKHIDKSWQYHHPDIKLSDMIERDIRS